MRRLGRDAELRDLVGERRDVLAHALESASVGSPTAVTGPSAGAR